MIEQEVTYSAVRFQKSSSLQSQVRPEETQDPGEASHRECSVPWHFIVIAFGILCAFLLATVAVLVTNIFQCSQENHELQETLTNLHYNCSTMQNDIILKEEELRNKSIECGAGNDLLESLNREQNRWYNETKTDLDSSLHAGRGIQTHWFCYGIKCYYFIKDRKTWSGCKQMCVNYSLSLLKIDDEDELKFLQLQIFKDSYWTGLSYNDKIKNWAWIDNDPSKLCWDSRQECLACLCLLKDVRYICCTCASHCTNIVMSWQGKKYSFEICLNTAEDLFLPVTQSTFVCRMDFFAPSHENIICCANRKTKLQEHWECSLT